MLYIISGTSSGIGNALAHYLLARNIRVIGISRTNTIFHPLFTFIFCDFSQKKELEKLEFTPYISKDNYPILLINNAGIIGEIKHTSHLSLDHFYSVAMVNSIAPQYITSKIIREFGLHNIDTIVMISSGAGRRPISSWSAYCASKASIDSFAETLQAEIRETGGKTKVFSIAPGVIDTPMQSYIRTIQTVDFSSLQRFIELKRENQLRLPEETARLLVEFIEGENSEREVICRI